MKKLLLCLMVALLVMGCTDAQAKLSQSTPLIKIGKNSLTSQDAFSFFMMNYGAETAVSFINDYLFEKVVGDDTKINEEVEKTLAEMRETYGEDYYSMWGYSSESEIIGEIRQGQKMEAILKQYLEDNYDMLMSAFLPTEMAALQFIDIDSANKALVELKAGGDLEKLAEKYQATPTFEGERMIYTTHSDLPVEVASYGLYATKPSIVDNPIVASDGYFYLVQVFSVDRLELKEDITAELIEDEEFTNEALSYYCETYNLTYYDKTIIDLMKKEHPEYSR